MKKLLVGLLVLVVLALAVDRGGDLAAQHLVATELEESQGLPDTPDVDITGFPFLTQLAANEFDRIDVTVRDLPLGDSAVSVTRLAVENNEVSRSGDRVTAARAEADALIGFADLSDALGVDVAYGDSENLRVSQGFEVAGQRVEPSVSVAPEIVDGALGFAEPVIEDLAGADSLAGDLAEVFGVTLPLDGLPFQVEVDDLRVAEDGLHVELTGRDLAYGG